MVTPWDFYTLINQKTVYVWCNLYYWLRSYIAAIKV